MNDVLQKIFVGAMDIKSLIFFVVLLEFIIFGLWYLYLTKFYLWKDMVSMNRAILHTIDDAEYGDNFEMSSINENTSIDVLNHDPMKN